MTGGRRIWRGAAGPRAAACRHLRTWAAPEATTSSGGKAAGHDGEQGFTLIEVVLASAVLALVAGVLATVIIVVFENSGGSATAATNARDEQLVGTYFTRDVESATSVGTTGAHRCDIDQSGPSQPVLEIVRSDQTVDYYWLHPVGGGAPAALHRQTCVGTTTTSDDALARSLDPTIVPTATCAPDPTCLGANESVTLTLHPTYEPQAFSITAGTRTSLPPPTTIRQGGD